MFIKRFLTRQSGAMLGRALPFGIGAVVGGGANLAMSRAVVKSTQEAFGPLPASFPPELSEVDRAPKLADDARDRSKDSEEAGEPAQISGEDQQSS